MMLPSFLYTDEQLRLMQERQRQWVDRRMERAVPWTDNIKWERELNIQAKTFKPLSLFKVVPLNSSEINKAKRANTACSPKKNFVYAEKRLRRGSLLETASGSRRGDVVFDSDIIIPCLHEVDERTFDWKRAPWMSLTPMEMLTLRPGTKRAKGRVIVAGLGLGHQLIEVSKRKQVKEIILVEKSQELVDWLLPKIKTHFARELTDVVVGDAEQVLRKMKADVALIDIFPNYGGNSFTEWVGVKGSATRREEKPIPCPGIKSFWCWGSGVLY